MKSFPAKISILFCLIFFVSINLQSQEIKWDNISFGIRSEFNINNKDFNKYWGNFPSAGFILNYYANEDFSFEGSLSFSYMKGKTDERNIPDLILLNMPAGLKYRFIKYKNFYINLIPGITNTTFIFTGENAEKVGENFIESEFGVFISLSLQFLFSQSGLETFASAQNIFSTAAITLYSFGLKFIW